MVDINDNDYKLLKMNESLLSKLSSDDDRFKKAIDTYKELAIKIDRSNYNDFIDKINKCSNNQSLQEELEYLEELENDYGQLNEIQCRFRNIYNTYGLDEDFKLSDLDRIDIDGISERRNLISGYLINNKNIADSKKKLDEYNDKLIALNKEEEDNSKRYHYLEEELKRMFLDAEGRIVDSSMKYTSVKIEYSDNEFDLGILLEDSELLEQTFKQALSEEMEQKEVLNAVDICYDKIPTKENRETRDVTRIDTIKANYRLALIKIVRLISHYENTYDKMIEKREQLKDLIKKRNEYLKILGKRYSVDPFGRIKVDEQLNYIKTNLRDNAREIARVRKLINEVSNRLDEMNSKNSSFLTELNSSDISFIKDTTSLSDISVGLDDDLIEQTKVYLDNQVVNVRDISSEFKIDRVHEKTDGVINRVYQMISDDTKNEKTNTYNPELVVENDDSNLLDNDNASIFDDSDLFAIGSEVDMEPDEPMFEFDNIGENKYLADDSANSMKIENDQEDSNLFHDNVDSPFGNIILFNDKIGDTEEEIFPQLDTTNQYELNEVKKEEVANEIDDMRMPEVFWKTETKEDNNSEEIESLDEQIKKLKLVA